MEHLWSESLQEISEDKSLGARSQSNKSDASFSRCRMETVSEEDFDQANAAVEKLRQMVKEEQHLESRTDDSFLLRFLRARKFDCARAFNLLSNYYAFRERYSKQLKELLPSSVKEILINDVHAFLEERDSEGRAISVLRIGRWNPCHHSFEDLFRACLMSLELAIESEETQKKGMVILIDLKDVSFNHLRSIPPHKAYRAISLLQDCFPCRLKATHVLHQPSSFDVVFSLLRPFLRNKFLERVLIHSEDMTSLHKHILPTSLPSEYGGSTGSFSVTLWAKRLLEKEDEFADNMKYGYLR